MQRSKTESERFFDTEQMPQIALRIVSAERTITRWIYRSKISGKLFIIYIYCFIKIEVV